MGTLLEEEVALALITLLTWILPLLVVLGACIDFSLFSLYQTKLHTWRGLFAETEPDPRFDGYINIAFQKMYTLKGLVLKTPTLQRMLVEEDNQTENFKLDLLFREEE